MADRAHRLRELVDRQSRTGELQSSEELIALLYDELRDLARARLARLTPGQTLQATDLVHETYARIQGREPDGWEGRRHFFFAAARSMRDILVEGARRRAMKERHLGVSRITLSEVLVEFQTPEDWMALDEALDRLEVHDLENYQVVMLRFFAGLEQDEVAAVLELSVSTVQRKWAYSRAWLLRSMSHS
ncbi:MAG: sigma-70 family RNA polymerase sigma factor [Planctomycetes bacterium]|nr:sigma-70 family RNA polymerase sigma factor [Planctomycetota bacterium]